MRDGALLAVTWGKGDKVVADIAACTLIGYLCGCFLTADVVMRLRAGRSAFEVGSGNPGMANVGAQLGVRWAVIVLAGDILKVIAAVALAAAACAALGDASEGTIDSGSALSSGVQLSSNLLQPLLSWPWAAGFPHSGTASTLLAGFGAIIGHDFPFWHRFRGGKGVTATCSAIILFSPLLGGIASVIGLMVVVVAHKLEAAALVIPISFLVGVLIVGAPFIVALFALAVVVVSVAVWLRARWKA